jgi:hypothetical protein
MDQGQISKSFAMLKIFIDLVISPSKCVKSERVEKGSNVFTALF